MSYNGTYIAWRLSIFPRHLQINKAKLISENLLPYYVDITCLIKKKKLAFTSINERVILINLYKSIPNSQVSSF